MLQKKSKRSAFTLLELAIVVVIFAAVTAVVIQVLTASQPIIGTTVAKLEVEDRGRKVLDRMVKEIRSAFRNTMTPADNTDETGPVSEISLEPILSFSDDLGTDPELGNIITYRLEENPNDPLNDVDDDGNGLVDEQLLVREEESKDTGVVTRVELASNVIEGQFLVERQDGRITISLSLARRDPNRREVIHQANLKTTTFLFNIDGAVE